MQRVVNEQSRMPCDATNAAQQRAKEPNEAEEEQDMLQRTAHEAFLHRRAQPPSRAAPEGAPAGEAMAHLQSRSTEVNHDQSLTYTHHTNRRRPFTTPRTHNPHDGATTMEDMEADEMQRPSAEEHMEPRSHEPRPQAAGTRPRRHI